MAINVPTVEVGQGKQRKVVEPVLLTALDPAGNIVPIRVDGSGNSAPAGSFSTRFGELMTAQRHSQMNLKPTWGISALRYTTSLTGTGATAGETSGEFRLQSGTANNGVARVQTNRRGLYVAGAMGQAGIGVRIPTMPASTAFCEWGYTDFTNGFFFGVDGTGAYVAYVSAGNVTKAYQADWNVDKLDGTGNSGKTLNLADGLISHIDFTWYGYGDIEFSYFIKNPTTLKIERETCHRFKLDGQASVADPNQPLSFRCGNGASTTADVSLYIGGHHFSILNGFSEPQKRLEGELLTGFTTAQNTNWQPLIAIRKKATFSGRPNSVNVALDSFQVSATGDLQVRITVNGTTSNLNWATPTGKPANETAVETKITGLTPLTTSADGIPTVYSYVLASGSGNSIKGTTEGHADFNLGAESEVILWVRRISASGSIIVNHAHIEWTSDW